MVDVQSLERYFIEVLSEKVKMVPWEGKKDIPFFLRNLYEYFKFSLFGKSCLVFYSKDEGKITPSQVNKHYQLLQEKWTGSAIYVCPKVTSYNRKRLIQHKIPFIVPGSQMYLPDLGLDMREYFRKEVKKDVKKLSPSAQTVIIYALIHKENQRFIPSNLAKELEYSAMTMTRALDELKSIGIGEIFQSGKQRVLNLIGDRKELWQKAKPFMRSPVNKFVYIKYQKDKKKIKQLEVKSGLLALSFLSMLNPPKVPVFAISIEERKDLMHLKEYIEVPSLEDADIELEIWSYNPKLFAKEALVDPFSLSRCLQGNKDERVESALEIMMEKIKW
jgi:hypothetical protein